MSNFWELYIICSLTFKKWHRFCCAGICRFIFSPARNIPPSGNQEPPSKRPAQPSKWVGLGLEEMPLLVREVMDWARGVVPFQGVTCECSNRTPCLVHIHATTVVWPITSHGWISEIASHTPSV